MCPRATREARRLQGMRRAREIEDNQDAMREATKADRTATTREEKMQHKCAWLRLYARHVELVRGQ